MSTLIPLLLKKKHKNSKFINEQSASIIVETKISRKMFETPYCEI